MMTNAMGLVVIAFVGHAIRIEGAAAEA